MSLLVEAGRIQVCRIRFVVFRHIILRLSDLKQPVTLLALSRKG